MFDLLDRISEEQFLNLCLVLLPILFAAFWVLMGKKTPK